MVCGQEPRQVQVLILSSVVCVKVNSPLCAMKRGNSNESSQACSEVREVLEGGFSN